MIDCMKYLSIELSNLLIIFWIHECSLITYNSSLITENILAMLKYSRLFVMICRSVLFLSAIHCTRVLFPIKRYGIRKQRPLWQYGLWSFQMGVQNYKDFCLRINILKGNYWILRIGLVGRCQKLAIILVSKVI